MAKPKLTNFLDNILGKDAANKDPKTRAQRVIEHLKAQGTTFKELEKTATRKKAVVMAEIVKLEMALKGAKLYSLVMGLLREMVGNSKGDGPRRAHSGQTFTHLFLEGPCEMPPSTASRHGRLVNLLVAEGIKPADFAATIEQRGGMDECLEQLPKTRATKPKGDNAGGDKKGRKKDATAGGDKDKENDDEADDFDDGEDDGEEAGKGTTGEAAKVRGAVKSKEKEDEDEDEDGDTASDIQPSHVVLMGVPGVLKGLAKLKDGHHAGGFVIEKRGREVMLKFVTTDPAMANTMRASMLAQGKRKLQKCHGINRRFLVSKLPRLPIADPRTWIKKPSVDIDSVWKN